MVHRHAILYKALGLAFLVITGALIFTGIVPAWDASTSTMLFILSLFSLLLSLTYFHLGTQEERGFSARRE